MARKRQYYQPFDLSHDGSWYFYIPHAHGPCASDPREGDMLVGPYYDYDKCYADAMQAQSRAIAAGLEMPCTS